MLKRITMFAKPLKNMAKEYSTFLQTAPSVAENITQIHNLWRNEVQHKIGLTESNPIYGVTKGAAYWERHLVEAASTKPSDIDGKKLYGPYYHHTSASNIENIVREGAMTPRHASNGYGCFAYFISSMENLVKNSKDTVGFVFYTEEPLIMLNAERREVKSSPDLSLLKVHIAACKTERDKDVWTLPEDILAEKQAPTPKLD